MTQNQLKKKLSELEKSDLVNFILDLCKENKIAKTCVYAHFDGGESLEKLYNQYYSKLEKLFNDPLNFMLKDAKVVLKAFENSCTDKKYIVRLQIYFVLQATQMTADFGDFDAEYYYYVEKIFEKALEKAKNDSDLMLEIKPYCLKILDFAKDCGWGFPDALEIIYDDFFCDFDLEEK